jgi:hypothetical protein
LSLSVTGQLAVPRDLAGQRMGSRVPGERGRLARLFDGIEPGRPVPPSLVLSSSPWALPIVIALGALLVTSSLGLLSVQTLARILPLRADHPLWETITTLPVGSTELLVLLAGFLLLFTLTSWSWINRVLIVAGTWIYATYNIGLLSWGAMEEAIFGLANQPGVDVFGPPPPGATDAAIVLTFAVLLLPALVLVALVLIWAWSGFLEQLFNPTGSRRLLPEWMLVVPFVAVIGAVAYAGNSLWLPWCLWVLGVVARAYLMVHG